MWNKVFVEKKLYLKLTPTMVGKYIIDAKAGIRNQFGITLNGSDKYVNAVFAKSFLDYPDGEEVKIKFYKTKRGDQRMSIPKLRKYADVGDYVWFAERPNIPTGESPVFLIYVSPELPVA
jgi:hypothetical protein